MNDTSESDGQPRDSILEKHELSDGLLKDSCSSRCGIAKVALRIPFRPETFKAQSLLARFHSSRKSDSGIKSELKASSGSGLGFGRGWRRQKAGNNFEVLPSGVAEAENTSASLPDDLNHNTQAARGEGGAVGGDNGVGAPREDLQRVFTRCFSEEVTLSSTGGQRDGDNLFGTWPGRPRKLKSLRKKLLATGSSSRINPDNVPSEKTRESEERETASLLPQTMDSHQWNDTPAGSQRMQTDPEEGTVSEMSSKAPEMASQNVSLDALLESLPLIYNPATKQLCLGTVKKTQNEPLGKGMSGKASFDETDRDIHPEKQKLVSSKIYPELSEECESQEDGLSNEPGEAPALSKALEIIQEVEESGETVKLIDKGSSPQSGNVSGSSSLERGNYECLRNSIQRIGTSNSLSITDASSFSSLSSLNTELSAYSASDSAVCLGSHQSDTGSLRDFILTDDDGKSKKRGIADFLTR